MRVASDLHLGERSVQVNDIFPWSWKETGVGDGLGEYYAPSLWSQPMHTFFGLLAIINIPLAVQTKLLGFTILILGFWGMWRLLAKFNINNFGKSIGSSFFLLNSFFLLLFDGGQLSLALAYCTLPTIAYYFLEVTEADFLIDKLKLALWILILSVFDIRIIYLALLIFFIFLVFKIFTISLKNSISLFKKLFLSAVIAGIILLIFHTYWLLPIFISKPIQLPQTYDRTSQIDFLSFSTLAHSIFLQQPHWYKNIFGRVSLPQAEFVFIPFLVFLVPLLTRKDTRVAVWLLVALVSIFLTKGSNPPLPGVYSWLFINVPGFQFFRDPSKFYFLICLSYSILLGFLVQFLTKMETDSLFIHRLIKVTPAVLILYFIFLARPVYLNQMSGLFSNPLFQKEFEQLAGILKKDDDFSRVFWIPTSASLGYVTPQHPAVEATRLSQKRPFAVGIKGTYETFNFLREASYMGEIFDVAGIGYLAYPYLDSKREDMSSDNIQYFYTFSGQLSKLPWLSKSQDSEIPLFKVKKHQDKFFVAQNIWWVIGSDDIYKESTKSGNLRLSNNALIFAEESVGLGKRLNEFGKINIILNKKNLIDLAASFIDSSSLVFPAKKLNFEPDKSGWWKREGVDLVEWRHFLQTKYGIDNQDFDLGGGWAIAEDKLKLNIQDGNISRDKILLARVMESTKSGQLNFYQNDKLIGQINTKQEGSNIRWFEVGKLNTKNKLTITSDGEINVVNALAILSKDEWLSYQNKALEFKNNGFITNFKEENLVQKSLSVSYTQVNPTKYLVNVSGLNSEVMLIFSENFDNLWQINQQSSSLPIFSLLNGFKIDKDGEYIIEFRAQRYVNIGLIISISAGLILVSVLIYKIKKGKPKI